MSNDVFFQNEDEPKMKSNLDIINDCDRFPYFQQNPDLYTSLSQQHVHFLIDGRVSTFGFMLPPVAKVFEGLPNWEYDEQAKTLTLINGQDERGRSAIVAQTCAAMRETGHFQVLKGWRDELYPVYDVTGELMFEIERSASPLFGVVTYGIHLTAYVKSKIGGKDGMRIWVPRRARHKQTFGGMLDNTVAGGIAVGEKPFESLVREAEEEASLPEALVRERAHPVGVVSYFYVRDKSAGGETDLLQPEVQYVYDMEVEESTVPKPNDNEVEAFTLMSVAAVKDALAQGEFKPNCGVVLLDFFVRHGIITPETEADYFEIVARLHRMLEFPVAKLHADHL